MYVFFLKNRAIYSFVVYFHIIVSGFVFKYQYWHSGSAKWNTNTHTQKSQQHVINMFTMLFFLSVPQPVDTKNNRIQLRKKGEQNWDKKKQNTTIGSIDTPKHTTVNVNQCMLLPFFSLSISFYVSKFVIHRDYLYAIRANLNSNRRTKKKCLTAKGQT